MNIRTILSLAELCVAGSVFTVSLLNVSLYAAGGAAPMVINVVAAIVGAVSTLALLTPNLHAPSE